MKNNFVLTKENLIYLGLYDEFLKLYYDYNTILSDALCDVSEESIGNKIDFNSLDKMKVKANKQSRELFLDFLTKYSSIFVDGDIIYPDKYLISCTCIYEYSIIQDSRTATFSGRLIKHTFDVFLKNFEIWIVNRIVRYKIIKEANNTDYTVEQGVLVNRIKERISLCNQIIKADAKTDSNITNGNTIPNIIFDIIVFKLLSSTSCNLKNHRVISGFSCCRLSCKDDFARIPIHHCCNCGKNFIGLESLKLYEKNYGNLDIIKKNDRYEDFDYEKTLKESQLHKTGYNVKEGGLTEEQRHLLISNLIQSKTMNKYAIIRDIEKAIVIFDNNPRFNNAITKWKNDLRFVNEYSDCNNIVSICED